MEKFRAHRFIRRAFALIAGIFAPFFVGLSGVFFFGMIQMLVDGDDWRSIGSVLLDLAGHEAIGDVFGVCWPWLLAFGLVSATVSGSSREPKSTWRAMMSGGMLAGALSGMALFVNWLRYGSEMTEGEGWIGFIVVPIAAMIAGALTWWTMYRFNLVMDRRMI